MKWTNRQFGEFEYEPDHVLTFPNGVIGFEELTRYILINDEDTRPLLWLVSLEDHDLGFPVLLPDLIAERYSVETGDASDATVLAVVSLKEHLETSTVNLRSPIIIDNVKRTGRQTVLENDRYPFQHPLFRTVEQPVKG